MKVSREKALSDWESSILRGYIPDPGPPPDKPQKTYKDNPHNEWLTKAVKKLGGTRKVSKMIDRSAAYIYNMKKGYCPLSKEVENLINQELRKLHD